MQTTETTTDFIVTAARAYILAGVIHGQTADGDARPAIEQAKRVAQAVRTERQRAILWLHQTLNHEAVTWEILIALGFDQRLVDAADTLSRRCRESVRDYAKRVAACDDTDVLAVAVAAIDNQSEEGGEQQDGTLAAYKKARRVLQRAADALANQQPGDTPPAGGVADDRPTEAGPAHRVDDVDGTHRRGAGGDVSDYATAASSRGELADQRERYATAPRQRARRDAGRGAVVHRPDRGGEREEVRRGQNEAVEDQDLEGRHRDEHANDRTSTARLLLSARWRGTTTLSMLNIPARPRPCQRFTCRLTATGA